MNGTKKFLVAMALFFVTTVGAWAINEYNLLHFEGVGIMNYEEIEAEFKNEEDLRSMAKDLFESEGLKFVDCMVIDEDNAVDRDFELIEFLDEYIYESQAEIMMNGDTYLSIAIDCKDGNNIFCWLTWSIIVNTEDYLVVHFPLYIHILDI